jgi:hypothetical protein
MLEIGINVDLDGWAFLGSRAVCAPTESESILAAL